MYDKIHYNKKKKKKKISGGDENIANIFRALANLMKRFCTGYHSIYIENLLKI